MIALSSFVRFHATRSPDRPAIAYAGAHISYGELMRRIETAAGWLAARGLRPGDVVALGLGAADRLLIAGPLYHVGAFDLPGMAVLWVGGMIAIERDFDPARMLAAIAREKLTGAWLAPVMLRGILTHPGRFDHDLTSMRWV